MIMADIEDIKTEETEAVKKHHDYRTHNILVSLSDEEFEKFSHLLEESGLRKTAFVRKMLTEGKVISPLSAEEKTTINQLSKTARDLHRLLGAAYKEGLEKHVKWMNKIAIEFEQELQNIKEKIS